MFDMVLITSLQWSCFLFTDGNYSCEMVLGDGGGGNGEYYIGDYTLNDCIKNLLQKEIQTVLALMDSTEKQMLDLMMTRRVTVRIDTQLVVHLTLLATLRDTNE